jgi:hypothetical protein
VYRALLILLEAMLVSAGVPGREKLVHTACTAVNSENLLAHAYPCFGGFVLVHLSASAAPLSKRQQHFKIPVGLTSPGFGHD